MGILSIVSTPIGNLDDITIRAIKTLLTTDVILCEDTRRTGSLIQHLQTLNLLHTIIAKTVDNNSAAAIKMSTQGVENRTRLIRFDDHTEERIVPEVIQLLERGFSVALVSDAGTPLISDPGFRLVRECLKRNIKVESIPGASAVLAALTSSGLPTDKFMFLGYPPEKQSQRMKLFQSLLQCFKTLIQNPTIIFYCAPHKLIQSLEDIKSVFGDIDITIARELTKIHEEIWEGSISEAITHFKNPKGELVLLFSVH